MRNDLIKNVTAKGMRSVANHGSMFGTIDFYSKAKAAGVKPNIGTEAYVAARGASGRSERIGHYLHPSTCSRGLCLVTSLAGRHLVDQEAQPEDALLDELAELIQSIGGKGEFAVEDSMSVREPGVRVRGVGTLPLTVTDAWARKLVAVAQPAPFGLRDRTLHDDRIRRTWQIEAGELTISETWSRMIQEHASALVRRLGFAPGGEIEAIADKLLVYEPGDFFAPHQDSERIDGMLASLVVVLPSRHTGGELIVEHKGAKKTLGDSWSADQPTLLAFYADCRHQVAPVRTGHRITLTFHLVQRGAKQPPPRRSTVQVRLKEGLRTYFSTPRKTYYSQRGEPPDRFVYLLDHEYTQRGLGWNHLKGLDRQRVAELAAAANPLDCVCFLALADVHETWSCDDDSYDGGYRRKRYHHDDEDIEDDDGDDFDHSTEGGRDDDYTLTELIDSEVSLDHLVGPDGSVERGIPAYVHSDEVCFSSSPEDQKPYRSEHEGYMGNYGNTVDRWYHRAALVIWPRERTFVLRAQQSPAWAIQEIRRLMKAGNREEAERNAASLESFWPSTASQQPGVKFFKDVVQVARSLGSAKRASALLASFGPDRLTDATLPVVLQAAEQFGLDWSKEIFGAWRKRAGFEAAGLTQTLPGIAAALAGHRWSDAPRLGLALLQVERADFEQRYGKSGPSLRLTRGQRQVDSLCREALALFQSAAALNATAERDALVAFLVSPAVDLPTTALAEILRSARAQRTPPPAGLAQLHAHVLQQARGDATRPPRAPGDWSIVVSLGCDCALCGPLSTFLADPKSVEHRWPLSTERRQHVHNKIDALELPVRHETLRTGRPYTLILRKQQALFVRDAARKVEEAKLLEWLVAQEAAFHGGGAPHVTGRARTRTPAR